MRIFKLKQTDVIPRLEYRTDIWYTEPWFTAYEIKLKYRLFKFFPYIGIKQVTADRIDQTIWLEHQTPQQRLLDELRFRLGLR